VAPRRCNSHEPRPDGGNLLAGGWRFWLTARRGATDPVCGMPVDRPKAIKNEFAGGTFYFYSQHCLHVFEQTPDRDLHGSEKRAHEHAQAHAH
jgi:YHS domain-containing protein